MAASGVEWCFDVLTDTVGSLTTKIDKYESALESAYNTKVTDADWTTISTEGNFSQYYPSVATKPAWSVIYSFDASKADIPITLPGTIAMVDRTGIRSKLSDELFSETRNTILEIRTSLLIDGLLIEKINALENRYVPKSAGVSNPLPPEFMREIDNLKAETWKTADSSTFNQYISIIIDGINNILSQPTFAGSKPLEDLKNILSELKDIYNEAIFKYSGILDASSSPRCNPDLEPFILNEVKKLFKPNIEIEAALARYKAASGGPAGGFGAAAAASSARAKATAGAASVIEQALAEQVIFQEQCFMLGNIIELVENRKNTTALPLPYVTPATASAATTTSTPAPPPVLNNSPINIQGGAFAFVNKLAVSPDQKFLFELETEEISSITPNMRFFKVDSNPEDGTDLSTEIEFKTNIKDDLDQYMSRARNSTKGGRGLGVGVKSFNFSYDGTDPFSAKKAISAKLVLYAPSFSDLLRERTGDNGVKYSYVDLALKTGKYKGKRAEEAEQKSKEGTLDEIERENLDKLNFRLKAMVQWSADKKNLRLFDGGKKDAIYNSAISFYLTPTIHEFDFDETGAVTFTINYLAYIEDYFAQPRFDVFGGLGPEKIFRDLAQDYFRQAECDTAGYDSFKEKDEEYVTKLNVTSLNRIIKKLRQNKLIYYISTSKQEMKEWLQNPTKNNYINKITTSPQISISDSMVDTAVNKAKTAGATKEESKGAYRLSLVANSDLRENVSFFYLSDLVDAAMSIVEEGLTEPATSDGYYSEVIESSFSGAAEVKSYVDSKLEKKKATDLLATKEQFRKMRVVLGPMELTPYTLKKTAEQKMYSCTVGDLPISLNYFLDFMSDKVLSNDFVSYPLSKFIKDIINDCIRNFLNSDGCFRTDSAQRISINSTTVLAYNTIEGGAGEDDLTKLIIQGNGVWSDNNCLLLNEEALTSRLPLLKISGPNDQRTKLDISKMRNYYIFSVGRRYPVDKYVGNPEFDAKNGIFHYVLGANKGIVKNISLDKTSTPGLKELRFEQEGFDGLTQLREVYNANISTFLNPQTFPGTYIYVEPAGFDPTIDENVDLTNFGIGGYYMIVKTEHSIEPGNAETMINAAWVASKGGKIQVSNEGVKRRNEEGTEKILKCRVKAISSDKRGSS